MELQPVAPAAEDAPARSPQHHRHQRKGGGTTRPWLVVGGAGESRVEEFGKHAIMKRTGLPARDLRILDPMLSYPSTVLGRERAIVVKLEQIKAIITAHEVLVLNPRDPLVVPFAQDVVTRVSGGTNDGAAKTPQKSETDTETVKNDVYSTLDPSKAGSPKGLPFEFKALEACLEYACRSLESEASTLEEEAYPALDALTSKISTLHLERVRQIKSRLVAISGRVQKVRDELENLLDDDMDMAEMYLTEKLNRHDVDEISIDEIDDDDIQPENERDEVFTNKGRESVENLSFAPDIEDLEMLLEAYFVQIEGTLNKLSTLREYVDDTEDYINIMLDDKQNQLLQMGVMLSTATLLTSAGIAVVGLFGMNIQIDLYASAIEKFKFWETTFGTIAGCLVLFVTTIVWGKRKGLLSW